MSSNTFTLNKTGIPTEIEFSRKKLEDILYFKSSYTGLSNRSFSHDVYYINLDDRRILLMYNTSENQNIINNYTEISYDETFDPVNKLKFDNDNLVTAYTGNGDYTDLNSAHLLLVDILVDSSFLVTLGSNKNLEGGQTKINFNNIIQNNNNLYNSANDELTADYDGVYIIQGVINIYCTRNNVLPADMTVKLFYNGNEMIETTVTIKHTNMIHSIPINLSAKLNKNDTIFLGMIPGVASNRLFMKADSYWSCRLIKLTI